MSQEIENGPNENLSAVIRDGEKLLSDLQPGSGRKQDSTELHLEVASSNERMNAFLDALRTGRFNDPVTYTFRNNKGEIERREDWSLRGFLQKVLEDAEDMSRENVPISEQARQAFEQRAQAVRDLLAKIEKLVGSQ